MTTSGQSDFDTLWQAAQAGNAGAKYGLANYYGQRKQVRRALRWLMESAGDGHADAQFTLGCWYMQGHHVRRDWREARVLFDRASESKHGPALNTRAVLRVLGAGGDNGWQDACGDLIFAARCGDVAAICQLGVLLSAGGDDKLSSRLLVDAAHLGSAAASYLITRRAERAGLKMPGSNDESDSDLLRRLREASPGLPFECQMETTDLAAFAETLAIDLKSKIDWVDVANALPRLSDCDLPAPQLLSEVPRAVIYEGLLNAEQCEYMILAALPRLRPSEVIDPATGQTFRDPYRTSSDMRFWPLDQDLVIHWINWSIARATGTSLENQEMLTVLHYTVGQEYKPHFDFLTEQDDLAISGQRIKTVLISLSDDFGGGETHFPSPGTWFKGDPGDAISFDNVTTGGEKDEAALHTGMPITSGVKWLASKWIREEVYRL